MPRKTWRGGVLLLPMMTVDFVAPIVDRGEAGRNMYLWCYKIEPLGITKYFVVAEIGK